MNTFVHWLNKAIKRPELAAEIREFIAIWLGPLSSYEIYILAPALMKTSVIEIIKVPAIRKLTLLAK